MTTLNSKFGGPPRPDLIGKAKLQEVQRLLDQIQKDVDTVDLSSEQCNAALEQLKIYGRDPQNADPIFTKEGIKILGQVAINNSSYPTSQQALRCLANALLLNPSSRQTFVDLKYESKLCGRLERDDRNDEFLISRIIFLTTYGTNVNIENLIDEHYLAKNICNNIERHVSIDFKANADPIAGMALVESLKLIFNLTYYCPQRASAFAPAIPHLAKLLQQREASSKSPLDPPMGQLVSSLINLELSSENAKQGLFPPNDSTALVRSSIKLLDTSLKVYKESDLDTQVTPLITLLRLLYEAAPSDVEPFMKEQLLPSEQDRKQVLGKSNSLPSRLLRLTTAPMAPQIREEISNLLFTVCDQDPKKFTNAVGYGFASGFLVRHNIALPKDTFDEENDASNEKSSNSAAQGANFNPVTGQSREFEPQDLGPEMSNEEKEREAERLMVLFERLKANGVIQTEHPMAQMQREGKFEDSRFEELDSDED